MRKRITCFLPCTDPGQVRPTIQALRESPLVENIYLLSASETGEKEMDGCTVLPVKGLYHTGTYRQIAAHSETEYVLLYLKSLPLEPGLFALDRFAFLADDSQAGMLYADSYQVIEGVKKIHPVIDYQLGSVRDDFDFGSVLFFRTAVLKEAVAAMDKEYEHAGWYDLRLRIAEKSPIVHINEYLYSEIETDTRKSGEKVFDYVDPKNRSRQLEMEQVCTEYLKRTGAYLAPRFKEIRFDEAEFPVEASVIIPVFNRVRTIEDAIRSVLAQEAPFAYNLIVIDNHSTDGTTEKIRQFADDPRVIHLIPERTDLGIGGCWNAGVQHPACGKFAVQLDSDDVYKDGHTLEKIVKAFYEQNCAMVVGTYMITNFKMEMIPPGVIDHKEWTPENGRNNALRINGLGAPRAFYTPLLRRIHVPNTSYGEDYALGLYFSREYQIGRIYDVLYLCRRWEDNSDASLDIVKMNAHNLYKDRIRTWEIQARRQLNNR